MTEKTPKQEREDKIRELLDQQFVQAWFASGKNSFQEALTPKDATEVALRVLEPLLNALDEVATAADRITKSHEHFVQDSSDPGSEAMGAEWEMRRILKKLQYFEPHDWTYISRFSATPQEIHKILKDGLCEDTYLNYQRFICEPAVHEAAEELRQQNDKAFSQEDLLHSPVKHAMHHMVMKGADYIDPARGGGRWPASLINPS